MNVTEILILIGVLVTIPKDLVKGQEYLNIRGLMKTIQTKVFRISQNTEKSPGYLRGLALIPFQVKNYQPMLE